MSRRTALLSLLAIAAGGAAWNWITLQRTGAPAPPPVAVEPEPAPAAPANASALSLEKYPGPVADAAGVLSNWESTLEWLAKSWREDLGVDVQVAAIAAPDLPVEKLAADVFALRRVGADAATGGLLILLNPAREEARIEVSYTLEPVLPDALAGRIAHDQLAPYAAYHFVGMATQDVLEFLKYFLLQQAIEGKLALHPGLRARPAYLERARFLSGGAGASVHVPSAEELATRDFKARVEGPARKRYAPSRDPLGSAEAFLRVHQDLVGDPSLELLTEGSQCQRRGYPLAPYEEIERARRLEAARPWRAIVSGDRAVVTSDSPPPGFVPVLLQRVDGLWRVDLVETWKNLFFNERGNYWLHNSDNPYTFGLTAFGSGTPQGLEAWNLGGASIEQTIDTLRAKKTPLSDFLIGEVLFRNCFLSVEALTYYEKASNAAPGAHLFHETLGRRAEYLGFNDLALEAYGRISDFGAIDAARMQARRERFDLAAKAARRALERDPFDSQALGLLRDYLTAAKDEAGAASVAAQLASLAADPAKHLPVEVSIDPPDPVLDLDEPTRVGSSLVYDHTYFTATLVNPSSRPVEILSVQLLTAATNDTSGLGDIKDYWDYPSGNHRLEPGERLVLDRVWGFSSDTSNEQIRYVFDTCWRGVGEPRQCRATGVDVFPR